MKLEFPVDKSGYQKARILKRLISLIESYDLKDHFDLGLVNELSNELQQFLNQSDFDTWRNDDFDDIIETKKDNLKDILRDIFGPSRQEINLSKQREALIERAEHAEASAFEALAELADIAKDRDELQARIKELESELGQLKTNRE